MRPLKFTLLPLFVILLSSFVIPSQIHAQTTNDITSKIENLGNPSKTRWADNTSCVYARNVWDLQVFENKVYIGSGNSANDGPCVNAGPANIYVFDPATNLFKSEGTGAGYIDEEQVDRFIIIDNQLITPGHDPRWTSFPSWYRLESGKWVKYEDRAVNSSHAYDIYKYGNDWFLAAGNGNLTSQFNKSTDSGKTWSRVNSIWDTNRGTTFFELNNNFYGLSEWTTTGFGFRNAGLWKWDGTNFNILLTHTNAQMFPGVTLPANTKIPKALTFIGNIVYIGGHSYIDHQFVPMGLFKSSDIENISTISKMNLPRNALPWDLLIDNGVLMVLTSIKQPDNTYINSVIKTTDLNSFQEVFYFSSPTYAHSFEKLNNDFYFGQGTLTTPLSNSAGDILRYKTTTVLPSPSVSIKPGDTDGDNDVDIFDYNNLLTDYGKKNDAVTKSDLDNDDDVDIFDYNLLLTNFGK